MIIETLLALSLNTTPNIPHVGAILTPPVHTQVIAAYSSSRSSFSSSRSSFSSSSRSSFSSRPSTSSFSSRPSSSSSFSNRPVRVSTPKPVTVSKPVISSPKPSTAPSIPKAPTNNIVRVNKQVETPKPIVSTPKSTVASGSINSPSAVRSQPTRVITRDRYIERYNDGGIGSNPWFWMYMFNNNQPSQSAPTQVVVQSADGKEVKVPESQLIVKKTDSYNPIREFLVFALGGGIGVLAGRKFSL